MSKSISGICLTFAIAASLSSPAFGQADAKMKGNYNFWQAMGWQQQAQHQARSLYYYGQTQNPNPAQSQEHAAAARTAVTKAQTSLAELKKAHPTNKDAQESIMKIEAVQKKVLEHCDKCDKALMKGDHSAAGQCSADIVHDLHEANAELKKLQKALDLHEEVPKK